MALLSSLSSIYGKRQMSLFFYPFHLSLSEKTVYFYAPLSYYKSFNFAQQAIFTAVASVNFGKLSITFCQQLKGYCYYYYLCTNYYYLCKKLHSL